MTKLTDEAITAQEQNPQQSVETNEIGLVTGQEGIVTQDDASALIPCSICQEPIRAGATKCRHCGDYINKGWSGFKGKTLWDLLGLIVIPLTLAVVGFLLADMQDRRQTEIEGTRAQQQIDIEEGRIAAQSTVESNRARSNALQAYLDDMSDVMLHEDLEDTKTQSTMQARTISIVSELDSKRKALVINFLLDADIFNRLDLHRIDLSEVLLSGANLDFAYLDSANLSLANLRRANLNFADLRDATLIDADLGDADLRDAYLLNVDLSIADLRGADLTHAHLRGADLTHADLRGADLCGADLRDAYLSGVDLRGAKHNNATFWPEDFDPIAAGSIYVEEETR